jgi:hypothetical protein
MTKTQIRDAIRNKLATDTAWALRAIVRVYEKQTEAEQSAGQTFNQNGVGFSGTDAEILSSFARQINSGRTLSPKQMAIVMRKAPRYWGQIAPLIPPDRIAALVKAHVATAPSV